MGTKRTAPNSNPRFIKEDLRRISKRRDDRMELNRIIVPAVIVSVNGSTSPSNRPNQTWIDEYGAGSNYALAWNATGLTEEGTPVRVAKNPKHPYEYTILGIDVAYLEQDQGDTDIGILQLRKHARTHQMPEGNYGRDPVRVFHPALMPLRTSPSSGLIVSVYRLVYRLGNRSELFEGDFLDLTALVPATNYIRKVLIYLDTTTNALGYVAAAAVVNNGVIPVPEPDIPDDAIESSFVSLVGDQTIIVEYDIEHIQPWLNIPPELELPTPTQVGQILFAVTADEFVPALPLVDDNGFIIVDDDGIIVVDG